MKLFNTSALAVFLAASATLPTSVFGALRQNEGRAHDQNERDLKSSSSTNEREKKLQNKDLELCIGFFWDEVKKGDEAIWVDCDDAPKFKMTNSPELEIIPKKSQSSSDDKLCLARQNDLLVSAVKCDDTASENFYAFAVYDEKNDWRFYNRGGSNFLGNVVSMNEIEVAVDTIIESSVDVDVAFSDRRRAMEEEQLDVLHRRLEGTYFNVTNPDVELYENEERIEVVDSKRNKTLQVSEWRVDPRKWRTSRRLARLADDEFIVELSEVFTEIILLPIFVNVVGFLADDHKNQNQHYKGLECEFVFG